MLKEKIGQMLILGFKGYALSSQHPIVHAILSRQLGGVILFDYDFSTQTFDHNIQNPEQVKHLTQQLQSFAKQATGANPSLAIPLFIGIDYEGGMVNRLKERYGFPKTLSAAEIGNITPAEAMLYAEQMAKTLQQVGINVNFAPDLDVNVNLENPVIGKLGRSFSPDPQKVVDYARIFAQAYLARHIICAYKHFPGHGSSRGDTHAGFVDITETWKELELKPFEKLIGETKEMAMVMTAHVVHYGLDSKGYPASLSKTITQELLREKLQFNGVVVTDDMQMKAIADHYGLSQAMRLAINAGADMLVFGNQLSAPVEAQDLIEMIYADVQSGEIQESRIHEAYERILRLKKQVLLISPE